MYLRRQVPEFDSLRNSIFVDLSILHDDEEALAATGDQGAHGRFSMLEVADLDEALARVRKVSVFGQVLLPSTGDAGVMNPTGKLPVVAPLPLDHSL
jgi:hypothetical protein